MVGYKPQKLGRESNVMDSLIMGLSNDLDPFPLHSVGTHNTLSFGSLLLSRDREPYILLLRIHSHVAGASSWFGFDIVKESDPLK